MLLPSGLSARGMEDAAGTQSGFDSIIVPGDGGTTIDITNAIPIFAQSSPADAAAAAMQRLVPEPDIPRATPLHLTAGRYGKVPRHYIECLHDRTIPLADQRMMQAIEPCASVHALEADHSPFLSAPDALADALCEIAETLE